ncbi:MAG: hypothetical protein KA714_06100 [Limnoraphis sp. WC205]|jgi:hypothetical protein|nr:hypothetical protein [Limnoraphis sp. WC205]
MKCIHCGTDNNLKDRIANQGRCKECNSPFAFEPTAMKTVKITDGFFANALKDISVNGTLFFTPKQLFYLLEKRYQRKSSLTIGAFLFMYAVFLFLATVVLGSITSNFFDLPGSYVVCNIIFQFLSIFYLFSCSKSQNCNQKTRKSAANSLKIVGFFILLTGIPLGLFMLKSFPVFCIVLILGLLSIYLGFKQANQTGIAQKILINTTEFQEWLHRWQDINGTYPKLLPSPHQSLQPTTVNPDITNYSFDRLIVCDTPEIAQFLIVNNFHFEHNCAILSITGYPQNIFQTTMQMLRQNPDLKVYALHSCTPRGMTLVHHLRTNQNWFLDTNQGIIDLGITPRQVLKNERRMLIEFSPNSGKDSIELPIEIRGSLSTEELKWLDAGNFVKLESFNPQQLIQIIQRGITRDLSLDSGDSDSIFVENSDSSLYVFQSFG